MVSFIPALHRNSIANEMELVQRLREAELMGPYSGTLSINSNSDAAVQSEFLKSTDRHFFEVQPKLYLTLYILLGHMAALRY